MNVLVKLKSNFGGLYNYLQSGFFYCSLIIRFLKTILVNYSPFLLFLTMPWRRKKEKESKPRAIGFGNIK
jgi:hypothetical protein